MNNQDPNFLKDRKKTILIFGISSFVGSNLAEFLKDDYRVVGTYNKTHVSIPGVLTLPCDVLSKDEVQLVMFTIRPEFTIYTVGVSSVLDCAKNKELADALNTSGLFNVVEYCQRYKSQICYISSSYIFGGDERGYLEMDIPDPSTVYGKTQAAAEFYVQKTSLNYLIFRTCALYGRGFSSNRITYFENIQKRLDENEMIVCDNYINIGFLDVYYLAMLFRIAFEKKVTNRLLQVSSNDIMTHYDFTKLYSEKFLGNSSQVTNGKWPFPVVSSGASLPQSDKLFFKLDVSNVEGYFHLKMPSIKESLEFTHTRLGGKKAKKSRSGLVSSSGDEVVFI